MKNYDIYRSIYHFWKKSYIGQYSTFIYRSLAQPKFLLFLLFGCDISKYHKKCSKNFIFLTNFLRYWQISQPKSKKIKILVALMNDIATNFVAIYWQYHGMTYILNVKRIDFVLLPVLLNISTNSHRHPVLL